MCMCRRERYLNVCLQRIPTSVAIACLEAVDNERALESNTTLFQEWNVAHVVQFLQNGYTEHEKKRKHAQTLAHDVAALLKKMKTRNYQTSYDIMISGALENYKCHGHTGVRQVMRSIHQCPFNLEAYIQCMESFNFNPEKPVQSILRHFLLAAHYAEMEHRMILYDIEHYDDTDILKQELRLNSGYLFEFKSFIRMMRSEYPHTGVCPPHLITKEIAETDHPNLLLHAAFIMSFCAHTSRSSQMKQVIEAELKCIEQCKIQDSITTKTYAYCAMALSNLQVGLEQNALQCIDNALEIVPKMFRALEIRAQIFLVGKKYDAALRDLQVMLEHGPERKIQKSKIHGNLALVYQKKGDMRAAEQHIVKALEYDINNAACHLMLIYDAADVREFQVMERLLNHNVMLMNNTLGLIKIWSNVIDIYKREGNVQKADQYNDKLDKLVKSINRIS